MGNLEEFGAKVMFGYKIEDKKLVETSSFFPMFNTASALEFFKALNPLKLVVYLKKKTIKTEDIS